MRIVVCIKHAPDTDAGAFSGSGTLIRDSYSGLSELDTYAIEAGVKIAHGMRLGGEAAETVAITMGPEGAVATLRKSFAVGIDEGVHILDEALTGSDVHVTARVLAAAVRKLDEEYPVSLVFTGLASVDGVSALVPTLLAAELGWPALTRADKFELFEDHAEIRRSFRSVTEELTAPLPAVVSVTDQANFPRMPRGDDIVAARTKEFETWSLADLGIGPDEVGAAGSREVVESAEPAPERTERLLLGEDDIIELVDYLDERGLI